nr:hypothetical protein [Pandoravirus massiliensis]
MQQNGPPSKRPRLALRDQSDDASHGRMAAALPVEVWAHILDGLDTNCQHILDPIWRPWAASVCRTWAAIVHSPSNRSTNVLSWVGPGAAWHRPRMALPWIRARLVCASTVVDMLAAHAGCHQDVKEIIGWAMAVPGVDHDHVALCLLATGHPALVERALSMPSWEAACEAMAKRPMWSPDFCAGGKWWIDEPVRRRPYHAPNRPGSRSDGLVGAAMAVAARRGHAQLCARLLGQYKSITSFRDRCWKDAAALASPAMIIMLFEGVIHSAESNHAKSHWTNCWDAITTAAGIEAMIEAVRSMAQASDEVKAETGKVWLNEIEHYLGSKCYLQNSARSDHPGLLAYYDAHGMPYDHRSIMREAAQSGTVDTCVRLWNAHGPALASPCAIFDWIANDAERHSKACSRSRGKFLWLRDTLGFVPDASRIGALWGRSGAPESREANIYVLAAAAVWPQCAQPSIADALVRLCAPQRKMDALGRAVARFDRASVPPADLWDAVLGVIDSLKHSFASASFSLPLIELLWWLAVRCGKAIGSFGATEIRGSVEWEASVWGRRAVLDYEPVPADPCLWTRWCRVRPTTAARLGTTVAYLPYIDITETALSQNERAHRAVRGLFDAGLIEDDADARAFITAVESWLADHRGPSHGARPEPISLCA